jgi:hypothetical protein
MFQTFCIKRPNILFVKLLHKAQIDPVTSETSKKKIEFKHTKVQRRSDVERRRRKKRIEWMKKL